MEIAVLVKVVADRETVEPSADRATSRPLASEFVNPYDQRAVRVALDLRREGERVTVVSMGPESVAPVLAPYRTAGVDRILLVSDERLRGSDLVGTARALCAALRSVGPGIVLAGERATDSETGALAPIVAARLGIPSATRARAIVRAAGAEDFEVETDREDGTERLRLRAPALISVGEKIAKPLKVAASEGVSTGVEHLGIEALGLSAEEVGARGARTSVITIASIGRTRVPQLFDVAHLSEGVALLRTAEREGTLPPALPESRGPTHGRGVRIVVPSCDDSGDLDPAALFLVAGIERMLPGATIDAVWCGAPPGPETHRQLTAAGLSTIYLGAAAEGGARPDVVSRSLARAIGPPREGIVAVIPHTSFGLEIAGDLAGRNDWGIVTDAESVTAGSEGRPAWTKPSWGARYLATVEARNTPCVVTMRPRWSTPTPTQERAPPPRWVDLPPDPISQPVERIARVHHRPTEFGDLDRAGWIVGVGTGIGGPEAIRAIARAIQPYGGAIAATRRVVDAGWVPVDLQVGLTGRSPAPRLAILAGVSGSPNQMIGWRRAGTLVAINPEPTAPVFRGVDLGFVGRHEEVLPAVLSTLGVPSV